MQISIRPRELLVPEAEPFEHDKLRRRDSILVLSDLLQSISGSSVIAVDAGWGMGKTTFLRMWAQHLRNGAFPVAIFNAWQTDFSDQPFLALSSELMDGLAQHPDMKGRAPLHRLKRAASSVARLAPLPATRVVAAAIPGVGAQLAQELSPAVLSPFDEELVRYTETKNAYEEFRRRLGEAAAELSAGANCRPLVVMIDELDRCRPSYAVALLETAKHLFDADHIVFVLALNRDQLAHSIKAVYGDRIDASNYVGRFFDLDYRLPDPNRQLLITTALDSFSIANFESGRSWFGGTEEDFPKSLLPLILDRPSLSHRQLLQTIHRLAVIFASLPKAEPVHLEMLSILLTLRAVDASLYQRFAAGEVTDEEAIAAFGGIQPSSAPPKDRRRAQIAIESMHCIGACLASADGGHVPDARMHPLLSKYHRSASDIQALPLEQRREFRNAEAVVQRVSKLCEYSGIETAAAREQAVDNVNFTASIRQLELFPEPDAQGHTL